MTNQYNGYLKKTLNTLEKEKNVFDKQIAELKIQNQKAQSIEEFQTIAKQALDVLNAFEFHVAKSKTDVRGAQQQFEKSQNKILQALLLS